MFNIDIFLAPVCRKAAEVLVILSANQGLPAAKAHVNNAHALAQVLGQQ